MEFECFFVVERNALVPGSILVERSSSTSLSLPDHRSVEHALVGQGIALSDLITALVAQTIALVNTAPTFWSTRMWMWRTRTQHWAARTTDPKVVLVERQNVIISQFAVAPTKVGRCTPTSSER